MKRRFVLELLVIVLVIAIFSVVVYLRYTHSEAELPTTTWTLPSCPRELTLQDGSRWAPPFWSNPTCRATISWNSPAIRVQSGVPFTISLPEPP